MKSSPLRAGRKTPSRRQILQPERPIILKWFGWTDKGKIRKNNEDSYLGLRFDGRELDHLGKEGEATVADMDFTFAVSDGMGGALAGEFASRIAVEKITTLLPRRFSRSPAGRTPDYPAAMTELFRHIHRSLGHLGQSYEECRGMETTMSLCWFTDQSVHFAHVGDSRIYQLPAGQRDVHQLTSDDTYVGWLLRQGLINDREARTHPRRNVLQKALGGENQFVDPQTGTVALKRGDTFLICSDGLAEGLYRHQMEDFLLAGRDGESQINPARELVESSVKNDGRDNVTALVVAVF